MATLTREEQEDAQEEGEVGDKAEEELSTTLVGLQVLQLHSPGTHIAHVLSGDGVQVLQQ